MLSDIVLTKCGHVFHKDCIKKVIDKKLDCPNCRFKLPNYKYYCKEISFEIEVN